MDENGIADLSQIYDAVIVGGGPAGLTCALFLARSRRSVLVIDDRKPRNYASHGIHGFLGQHGIKPAELLRRGRREAHEAGAAFCNVMATSATRDKDLFCLKTALGDALGRRLVLAYGLRDVLPEIPSLEKFYGTSIFHCPDCDGFEVSDKRVGVIGWTKKVVGLALKLYQWTSALTVLTDGHDLEVDEDLVERLERRKIAVRTEKITRLLGPRGKLREIGFADGGRLELDAMFFAIGLERTCYLDRQLGCREAELPPFLAVDHRKETTVENVYAIGDLIAGSQLAVTAAADGAICAIALNKSLLPPDCEI